MVTVYDRGPYVDERHINVSTMIGCSVDHHGAAYRALAAAGIKPAYWRAGTIRLTVADDMPMAHARALVINALTAGGVTVQEIR